MNEQDNQQSQHEPSDRAATVVVTDNEALGRYEAHEGDELAGFLDYHMDDGAIVFPHTEVHPDFAKRGIGIKLAARAVRDAAAKDLKMVPSCWFVQRWIDKHPEFQGYVK